MSPPRGRSGRRWPGLVACGGALAACAAWAGAPAVDGDFLEYLGSVDSSDVGWHDYLEQTDIDKVAPPPAATPARPEAPVTAPRKVKQK